MDSLNAVQKDFDVIIIGAGISGINSAYRVQTELPNYSYTILEDRDAIGGTWDLFRYPGIRSDSDMHTYGFSWLPWTSDRIIASGQSIQDYVVDCACRFGIDKKIRFHHRFLSGDWNSVDQRWRLAVEESGGTSFFSAKFVVAATGYYDYHEPLPTDLPGIENFEGKIAHPQFWPKDLDYSEKKVVIVGSGSTAVTLLPVLAEKAASVTMLQRSPSYVVSAPGKDSRAIFLRKYLPFWLATWLIRFKNTLVPLMFFKFCRRYPNAGGRLLKKEMTRLLDGCLDVDPHFSPTYGPWQQRLCLCPDEDFFVALRERRASIVTDTIRNFTPQSVLTGSGKKLEADIVIKATGLKLSILGGAKLTVDSELVNISNKLVWRSAMVQDVPNLMVVLGYTNASWTLGADTTAAMACRLLTHMDSAGWDSVVPRIKSGDIERVELLDFKSTYLERAKGVLPQAGTNGPWKPRSNYFADRWTASCGSLGNLVQDLEFRQRKC